MNANELADALDDVVANYIQMIADVDFSDVATMLRQQQAEIEALKAGKIRAYDNGVEDGRKPNTSLVKEAKYGITTKWDGITTYHETTEPIGKVQEK